MKNLKKSKKIKLSIIICTYNSPELIERCLNSILKQDFKENYEILLIDGGSDKKTLALLKNFERQYQHIKLIKNEKRFPEGYGKGKWLGFRESKGEIFGIIDQDNKLIGKDCLNRLISCFENQEIMGVACRLYFKEKDNLTNKVISLIGTDGFVAYRSLDFLINTYKLSLENRKDYEILKLNKDNLIVTGGNCFFYRKEFLEKAGGYVQDIDNLLALIKIGYNSIAIPKNCFTHHKAINSFFEFLKKKRKWGKEYSPKNREFSWMPKTPLERKELAINLLSILTMIPLFLEAFKIAYKTKKIQALFIPIIKFSTFIAYLSGRI